MLLKLHPHLAKEMISYRIDRLENARRRAYVYGYGGAIWLSRADINNDGSFSIRNVVGADEYAIGVDDNAYTNGAVIRALELTSKAAEACGVVQDYRWKDMASRLRIHRSSSGV